MADAKTEKKKDDGGGLEEKIAALVKKGMPRKMAEGVAKKQMASGGKDGEKKDSKPPWVREDGSYLPGLAPEERVTEDWSPEARAAAMAARKRKGLSSGLGDADKPRISYKKAPKAPAAAAAPKMTDADHQKIIRDGLEAIKGTRGKKRAEIQKQITDAQEARKGLHNDVKAKRSAEFGKRPLPGVDGHHGHDGDSEYLKAKHPDDGGEISGYKTTFGKFIAYNKDEKGWSNEKPHDKPEDAVKAAIERKRKPGFRTHA